MSHQGRFTSVFTAGSQLWLLFVPDNLITTVMLLMSEVKMICLRFFSAYEFMWGEKDQHSDARAFFGCCQKMFCMFCLFQHV